MALGPQIQRISSTAFPKTKSQVTLRKENIIQMARQMAAISQDSRKWLWQWILSDGTWEPRSSSGTSAKWQSLTSWIQLVAFWFAFWCLESGSYLNQQHHHGSQNCSAMLVSGASSTHSTISMSQSCYQNVLTKNRKLLKSKQDFEDFKRFFIALYSIEIL